MRESVGTITKMAHFWSDTSFFPCASATLRCMICKRARETVLNATELTFPPGDHSLVEFRHVMCDVIYFMFTALKIAPKSSQFRKSNTIRRMHVVLLLFHWPLPNVGIQNFGMWVMFNLAKAYRSIQKYIANRLVEDWEGSNGHIKDTTRLFHGPWHYSVGEHICAQAFMMWNRLVFIGFTNISKTQKRCKWTGFWKFVKFDMSSSINP